MEKISKIKIEHENIKMFFKDGIYYKACRGEVLYFSKEIGRRGKIGWSEFECECGIRTKDAREMAEKHGYSEGEAEFDVMGSKFTLILKIKLSEEELQKLKMKEMQLLEKVRKDVQQILQAQGKTESEKRIEKINEQLSKIQKDIVVVKRKGGKINEGYIARRGGIAIMRKERAIEMYEELKSKSDYEVEWIPKIIAQFDSKDIDAVMRAIAGLTDHENYRNIEYWEDDGKTLKIWVYEPFIRVGELARALRRYVQIIDNEEEIIEKKKKLTPEQLKKTHGDERHEMNLLVIF